MKKQKKFYKQLSRCNHCGKMYVVDNNTKNQTKYYCKKCYKIAYPNK